MEERGVSGEEVAASSRNTAAEVVERPLRRGEEVDRWTLDWIYFMFTGISHLRFGAEFWSGIFNSASTYVSTVYTYNVHKHEYLYLL